MALDHPAVREAINALAARGVTVVTLVSDVPGSKRVHYAGIDNSSAGRTAASLMGRFLRGLTGKVGLIAGSLALRDHIERQFGFEQVMAHEYPNLQVLPVRESRDDWRKLEEMTAQLLAEHPDLIGIYNVGGGTSGIVSALEASGRARDVVLLAHDLSDTNRKALIRGTIDAVINQDPGHEVRSAIRVLIAKADNVPLIEARSVSGSTSSCATICLRPSSLQLPSCPDLTGRSASGCHRGRRVNRHVKAGDDGVWPSQ